MADSLKGWNRCDCTHLRRGLLAEPVLAAVLLGGRLLPFSGITSCMAVHGLFCTLSCSRAQLCKHGARVCVETFCVCVCAQQAGQVALSAANQIFA